MSKKLEKIFQDYKTSLALTSRTAKLWIQYLGYIQILKDFIKAERTGNWNLHLISVCNMLNLFAATGHNNYAKSGRLYLQVMLELPLTHPWLYDKFVMGFTQFDDLIDIGQPSQRTSSLNK